MRPALVLNANVSGSMPDTDIAFATAGCWRTSAGHGIERLGGATQRRRVLQHADHEHVALVFGRRERGRHVRNRPTIASSITTNTPAASAPRFMTNRTPLLVTTGHAREPVVEALQEAVMHDVIVPQQQRAQRRRQRQRDEARDHDRDRDRHGELPIHLADQAAEERDRQEHRRQHQHDGDDRARHFLHRLLGGLRAPAGSRSS